MKSISTISRFVLLLLIASTVCACSAPNGGVDASGDATSQLTSDQRFAIGEAIQHCWGNDSRNVWTDRFSVALMVRTDEVGRVRFIVVADQDRDKLSEPSFRAFANRALRAVMHCSLPLPKTLLGRQNTLTFRFIPGWNAFDQLAPIAAMTSPSLSLPKSVPSSGQAYKNGFNGSSNLSGDATSQLTSDQRFAIGEAIQRCWSYDSRDVGKDEFSIMMTVRTDESGAVRLADVADVDHSKLSEPRFRAFAERAVRAVKDCANLPLPKTLLDRQNTLAFSFILVWNGVEPPAPIAVLPNPVPSPEQSYKDGFDDSQSNGRWWRSLAGETREGALDWPFSHGCVKERDIHSPLWLAGCLEARRRFVPMTSREAIDPEYKRGVDAETTVYMEQFNERIGQNAFNDCANKKARSGSYSSRDAVSVQQLINQCSAQSITWFDNCLSDGRNTEKECGAYISTAAMSAISRANK